MAEYIERNGAIDAMRRRLGPNTSPAQKTMLLLAAIDIRGIKPADVSPVRHGKWEKYKATVNLGYLRCSVCEDVYIDEDWLEDGRWNYCPNCGAKMDGGGENATD